MIENVARYPESLEVRDRSAGSEMPPATRWVVADHLSQQARGLFFEPGRDRRDFARDVVRVVQHRREVAGLACDRLLRQHVPVVASAEERNATLKLQEQRSEMPSQLHALRGLSLIHISEPTRL